MEELMEHYYQVGDDVAAHDGWGEGRQVCRP